MHCIGKILIGAFHDYEEIYDAIEDRNNKNGYKLIFYMRMMPWTPYSIFNLAMATTHLSLFHFMLGSISGMILDVILYCFVGGFWTQYQDYGIMIILMIGHQP